MNLLPKSRKARRRLAAVAIAAPILAASAALAFYALGDSVSFFYSPSQARAASVPAGRIAFVVADHRDQDSVAYTGELPDLFREGQGVVAKGAFRADGTFQASEILAKHDERYMPRELVRALKASGEWRGQAQTAANGQ